MTTDSTPAPEGEPSLPDDVWERFARDTEREIRNSAPKEPSARARIVARRLREQDERSVAEARRRPGRRGPGRRGGDSSRGDTAWRQGGTDAAERLLRRRSRLHGALAILLVVLLVLVALSPSRAWSFLTGKGWRHDGSAGPAPTSLPPETAPPTAAPPAVARDIPTLQRPFAGSPAEHWATGAAAIVPPRAAAYGTSSKAQAATALTQVKTFLVAANLDPAVLAGGRPDAALALVDPATNDALKMIDGRLAHPAANRDTTDLFSRFGPEVRPAGAVVKVRGRMTVRKGDLGGAEIDADYTFVYPTRKTGDTGASPQIARTVVRRTVSFQLPDPARYRHTAGRLALTHWNGDAANNSCGIHDGMLHPEFGAGPIASVSPSGSPTPTQTTSGPATDPYDRSKPITAERFGECGWASRT